MTGELERPNRLPPEITVADLCFSSAARIRRALLEQTIDGIDYYGDTFRSLNLCGHETILNIGSGDGLDEVSLAVGMGHKGSIVGLDLPTPGEDFSDRFIVAEMRLAEAGADNVSFVTGDAERLEFGDNQFDVILWINSGYYFKNIQAAMLETRRVLKPDGLFLNLTNGVENKAKHHEAVREIKNNLGVPIHRPLSFSFNLPYSRYILEPLFEMVQPHLQETEYELSYDNLYLLQHSIDTYRAGLSQEQVGGWAETRNQVIKEQVMPEIEANGVWRDSVQRGGATYRIPRR